MKRREFLSLVAMSGVAAATPSVALAADPRVFACKIALIGSRVVVATTIGGSGPYPFMIDTGGFLSFIDEALAKSLKLTSRWLDQRGKDVIVADVGTGSPR